MIRRTTLAAIASMVLLLTGCVQVQVTPTMPKLPWQSDKTEPTAAVTVPAYDDGPAATASYAPSDIRSPTTFAPRTTPPIPAKTSNPADCRTDEMHVEFVADPQASGPNYDAYLVWMTNVSSRSCQLLGYPGVDFMSSPGGEQVGHEGFRDRVYTPTRFSIQSGQRAAAEVRIADPATVPSCQAVPVPGVRVYVPNTWSPQFFAMPLQACSNPQAIQLTVRATRFVR